MTTHGIHGTLLQVTVLSCNNLQDTEWFSRQDPYAIVEYGGNRSRTRTCTDGGKNPTFQERFVYTLIEGLRELTVNVWNSNVVNHDNFIGGGRVQLAKAIAQGFDDSTWPLQSKSGRHSGEVRIIIQYSSFNAPANNYSQSAQPFGASHYSTPPPPLYQPNSGGAYPFPPHPAFPPSPYPPNSAAYPPPSAYPSSAAYPPPSAYPSSAAYPPPSAYPNSAAYPPPSAYPNSAAYPSSTSSLYPPDQPSPYPQPYPPQPYGSHYPPSAPYPPTYPPRY